jgi:hypothetical protein
MRQDFFSTMNRHTFSADKRQIRTKSWFVLENVCRGLEQKASSTRSFFYAGLAGLCPAFRYASSGKKHSIPPFKDPLNFEAHFHRFTLWIF